MEFWFSILTLLVSCAITSFVTHYLFEFKKRHSLLMIIGVTLCCSLVIAIGNGFGRPVRTSDELTIDDPKAFWPVVGILILAFMTQSIICFVWYFWNKWHKTKAISKTCLPIPISPGRISRYVPTVIHILVIGLFKSFSSLTKLIRRRA